MGPAPLEECPASGSAGEKNWDSEGHNGVGMCRGTRVQYDEKKISIFISSLDIKLVSAAKDCGASMQNLYD